MTPPRARRAARLGLGPALALALARRAARLGPALALAAGLAAGCRGDRPDPRDRGAVTFVGWGGPEERALVERALRAFARDNPDLRVTYTQVPGGGYDYLNKLRMMIAGGVAPDAFYVPDGAFGELVSRGLLLPLDPLVAAGGAFRPAEVWPTALDRYRWDGARLHRGGLYCLPKDVGPLAMFYNKDALRARGVPAPDPERPLGWAEALAFWRALASGDGPGTRYGVTGFPYEAAVWSSGAEVLSDDKRQWVLDRPAAAEAVQRCADLYAAHRVAPMAPYGSGPGPAQLFEAQAAATHIDGRWMVPRFRRLPFDWDVAPVPAAREGAPSVTWSGSVGLGVYAKSPRPASAFRLVAFLASRAGQALLSEAGFQVPNQIDLAGAEAYRQAGLRPEHPGVFVAALATSRPGPWTDTPDTFWHDVFWNVTGPVWRGERRAAELLPEVAPLINRALRENNPP
ncbi:MAG TPA: sugar ABC transporter substrate-binding protein [Polyangiaceae bacterium]|nr:sugar ABC transporter substrate-binding protein [Polyangiaceae bacterium]